MLLESTVNEFYIREAYRNDRNNKENNKSMGTQGRQRIQTWEYSGSIWTCHQTGRRRNRTGCTYLSRRWTDRNAWRNCRPRHRRNRADQGHDTGPVKRIKSKYPCRTERNLSRSNSGRSTGSHAHHRHDGKHRTKEQHLLLSRNGRENPETGKRNEHGRPADLFLF